MLHYERTNLALRSSGTSNNVENILGPCYSVSVVKTQTFLSFTVALRLIKHLFSSNFLRTLLETSLPIIL